MPDFPEKLLNMAEKVDGVFSMDNTLREESSPVF